MQGLVSFAGISTDFLVSAQMTLSQGTSPSVCTIDIAPLPFNPPNIGLLRWQYGGSAVNFPFSLLDKIEPVGDGEGRILWRLTVLDRRWAWRKTGAISGKYNTPEQIDNKEARPEGVRPLKDLMKDCLDAMGETDAVLNLNRQAGEETPEVDWDYERPVEALASLCDRTGHIVVLGLDNRVYIFQKGFGSQLPTGNLTIEAQQTFDPPEAPAAIVVVGAATRFQVDLELEPVGKEIDGTVKPILELSYAPKDANGKPTWAFNDYVYMMTVDPKWREIARESVWRWYRVKSFDRSSGGPGPYTLPGTGGKIKITSIDEILPLLDVQVETYQNEDRKKVPRPAWVWGKFSPLEDSYTAVERPDRRLRNEPKGLYTGNFSVDVETGIVYFDSPTLILPEDERVGANGLSPGPADIKLRIAVEYREGGYKGPTRPEYHRSRRPSNRRSQSPPRAWTEFVVNDSLQRGIYRDGESDEIKDNNEELERRALLTWKTVAARYSSVDTAASISYAGFVPLACDGAITQVTWSIAENGETRTRASRNREESIIAPTYAERRLFERVEQNLRHRK